MSKIQELRKHQKRRKQALRNRVSLISEEKLASEHAAQALRGPRYAVNRDAYARIIIDCRAWGLDIDTAYRITLEAVSTYRPDDGLLFAVEDIVNVIFQLNWEGYHEHVTNWGYDTVLTALREPQPNADIHERMDIWQTVLRSDAGAHPEPGYILLWNLSTFPATHPIRTEDVMRQLKASQPIPLTDILETLSELSHALQAARPDTFKMGIYSNETELVTDFLSTRENYQNRMSAPLN